MATVVKNIVNEPKIFLNANERKDMKYTGNVKLEIIVVPLKKVCVKWWRKACFRNTSYKGIAIYFNLVILQTKDTNMDIYIFFNKLILKYIFLYFIT